MNIGLKIKSSAQICCFLLTIPLLLAGCDTLPYDYPRPNSSALENPRQTTLGKAFAEMEEKHPGESGYRLLSDGVDAFVARLTLMKAAQETIDVQYYIYRFNDLCGQMFTEQLIEAADRGVRVRLLLDDMEIEGTDFEFAVLATHPNIEVRFFNPFSGRSGFGRYWSILSDFERVNQRMHNKIIAVDNQLAIVGGRNIGDKYFTVEPNQYFADLELLAAGPIVREASASFDAFWNSELSIPVGVLVGSEPTEEDRQDLVKKLKKTWGEHESHEYRRRLREANFTQKVNSHALELIWAPGKVVYDDPEQITAKDGQEIDQLTLLGAYLEPHFDNTGVEFLLISPYMIPGDKGMSLFRDLRERGVRFKILTNSLAATDLAVVYAAYADYRKRILEMGIELYELKPSAGIPVDAKGGMPSAGATLHAKTLVFDRAEIFIGSMNLDPRSVYLNTELGLIVTSPILAERVRDLFAQMTTAEWSLRLSLEEGELIWTTEEDGETVRYKRSPYVSFWDILWSDLLELLMPNSLL